MAPENPEEQPPQERSLPTPAAGNPVPASATHPGHTTFPKLKFLEELKRRNVGRVAILYIIVCYLTIEVFGVFIHVLELPAWIGRSIVLLMVIGFPVALLIAWIYEITPEGLKQTDAVPHKQSIRLQTGKRLDRAIIATLSVALIYFIVDKFWLSKHTDVHTTTANASEQVSASTVAGAPPSATPTRPAAAISDKSIAVLPFVDMSEKHDQEYFSDGLSEELIDHLAHITDLKVIARTSSFAFKGKNEDMRTIATKLGVENLLEGSVRRSGDTLRITAQLIRASDGVHRWSETYDRKFIDIFKIQGEISTTVAKALNAALNLSDGPGWQPTTTGTGNLDAYNLFLQGNYFFARSGTGDLERAVERFKRAVAVEPNYAMAWARLALVYSWQGSQGELNDAEAESKGKEAAQRALAIDPNCAEAYYARGNIFRLVAGNWSAAKSDYERAVALDPQSVAGVYSQGFIFDLRGAMSGRFDEQIDWARRQLERDPLDTDAMFLLGSSQQAPGHYDDSVATFRGLVELNPTYAYAWAQYGLSLLYSGRIVEALAMAEKETDRAPKLGVSAMIYWAMDRRAESDSALAALEREFSDSSQYLIAIAHAYRGEKDATFTWLDRAYQQRRGNLEYLKVEPGLDKFHNDPRFKALLRKLNLPE